MFDSGPAHGENIGAYRGDPLYHASLNPDEYIALFGSIGFEVVAYALDIRSTSGSVSRHVEVSPVLQIRDATGIRTNCWQSAT
jgi:hypothetical protein